MKLHENFESLLLHLRCALHGEMPDEAADFGQLLPEARKQAVDGMLYDVSGIRLPVERTQRMRLVGNLMTLEKQNAWMDSQVAELAHRLDEQDIRYAVMKGQTCAAFYPNPRHRRPGDIDVYVSPQDFERANQTVLSWGAKLVDKTMLHSTYKLGKLDIEMHFAVQKLQYAPYYRQLKDMTAQEFDTQVNDSRLNIGGYGVRVLPNELNMVLLTAHAFNHVVSGGLGLRQVIDWQVVLAAKADVMDWAKLLNFLERLHLRRMFLVLAYINVKYLGMDEMLFSSRGLDVNSSNVKRMAERLLDWVEVCGNFGHSMNLGTGRAYMVRYYVLFLYNVVRFFPLNRMEMLSWPWMKAYRALTHKNHLRIKSL